MNEDQLNAALHENNVSAAVEIEDGGLVVLKMAEGTYNRLLKRYDFDGPAVRSFLENIMGAGRVGFALAGSEYWLGFKGDIAEVHAAEERALKKEHISHLCSLIPRLQNELDELESENE